MTICLRRLVSPIAAMVAILAMVMATPARADLEIWASSSTGTNDNPPTNPPDFLEGGSTSTPSFTGTVGGFAITGLSAFTNSPGVSGLSLETGSNTDITNNNSSTATLYISIGSTGFTTPVAPPAVMLRSHIGFNIITDGSANALTFQSFLNESNTQNASSGLTGGPQTPNITFIQAGSSDLPTILTTVTVPFSLNEQLAITLPAGGELNFASATQLSSIVPEPSSLAIAGLGALGLIGYGLRRRKGA